MQAITLRDGATLKVEATGSGTPLVLISGLGGTAGFWGPLVRELGPSLNAVRFDQRGIGSSERGTVDVTIRSLAEDCWQVIDEIGIDAPILCGHSTGGAIVQEMVTMRPGIAAGIILSGSWAGPDPFMQNMFNIRLDLLAKLPDRYPVLSALLGSPPRWLHDNPQVVRQAIASPPDDTQAAIIRERIQALLSHDCRDRLSGIDVPALVIGAEDDMIVPVYLQEELAASLSDPHLHVFRHGGHFFPVTRPADTAKILLDWLAGLKTEERPQPRGNDL